MSVFVCKRHYWWRQIWRHLYVSVLKYWAKFSNLLIRWSIRMILAKTYETVFKFVKVMPILVAFSGHGVYGCPENFRVSLTTPTATFTFWWKLLHSNNAMSWPLRRRERRPFFFRAMLHRARLIMPQYVICVCLWRSGTVITYVGILQN